MFKTLSDHSESDSSMKIPLYPYMTCALLNSIIPDDVQGDTAVTEIINMVRSTQRRSGICRIKLT